MHLTTSEHSLVDVLIKFLGLIRALQRCDHLGGQKRHGQRDVAGGCDNFVAGCIDPKFQSIFSLTHNDVARTILSFAVDATTGRVHCVRVMPTLYQKPHLI